MKKVIKLTESDLVNIIGEMAGIVPLERKK
jgi:hypothetical protein